MMSVSHRNFLVLILIWVYGGDPESQGKSYLKVMRPGEPDEQLSPREVTNKLTSNKSIKNDIVKQQSGQNKHTDDPPEDHRLGINTVLICVRFGKTGSL